MHFTTIKQAIYIICTLMLAGCAAKPEAFPAVAVVDESLLNETGNIKLLPGDMHVVVAPSHSATAGSKWIEATIKYVNTSDHPVWIDGYSVESPFYQIDTRSVDVNEWKSRGMMSCGTGAGRHRIAPKAEHSFSIALPEEHAGQEFRVSLNYYNAETAEVSVEVTSVAHVLKPAAVT